MKRRNNEEMKRKAMKLCADENEWRRSDEGQDQ